MGSGLAEGISGALQGLAKHQAKKQEQGQLSDLAKRIEEANPDSKFHKMVADVYRSPLDFEKKQSQEALKMNQFHR